MYIYMRTGMILIIHEESLDQPEQVNVGNNVGTSDGRNHYRELSYFDFPTALSPKHIIFILHSSSFVASLEVC